MINILLDVIFDQNGHIRVERIENLFDVLVQDSSTPAKELIPVAGAGLKPVSYTHLTLPTNREV